MVLNDVLHMVALAGASNISVNERWVNCSCPFAETHHPTGKDDRPSFGVLADHEHSVYKCYVCGKGSLYDFLYRYNSTFGSSQELTEFILSREGSVSPEDSGVFLHEEVPDCPVPSTVLDFCPSLDLAVGIDAEIVMSYLTNTRRIFPSIIEQFDLRKTRDEPVVVIPWDFRGKYYKLRARSVYSKDYYYLTPKLLGLDIPKWNNRSLWFGITYTDSTLPVLLVEGEMDLLRLHSLGITNVLTSGGSISSEQLDRLDSYKEVMLGFDSDIPGAKYCLQVMEDRFKKGLQKEFRRYSWRSAGIKDAGELVSSKEYNKVLYESRIVKPDLAAKVALAQEPSRQTINPLKVGAYRDKYTTLLEGA